ncbi:MAG TPA: CotH kinase family protein, partial [Candidatus Sabulitectum sp.]|nr:CotH kinase family protein [Candidatus Sabulitectum sp.]
MTLLLVFGLLFPSQVPEYSITCDQAQFENMMENWEQEITIPCTVTHQGIIYENCTMRIRGDTSRAYRKKSYRVEFPPDQPLHGRTTWNFNAEYADRSYMRAWL